MCTQCCPIDGNLLGVARGGEGGGGGAFWSRVYILSDVLRVSSGQFGRDSSGNCQNLRTF